MNETHVIGMLLGVILTSIAMGIVIEPLARGVLFREMKRHYPAIYHSPWLSRIRGVLERQSRVAKRYLRNWGVGIAVILSISMLEWPARRYALFLGALTGVWFVATLLSLGVYRTGRRVLCHALRMSGVCSIQGRVISITRHSDEQASITILTRTRRKKLVAKSSLLSEHRVMIDTQVIAYHAEGIETFTDHLYPPRGNGCWWEPVDRAIDVLVIYRPGTELVSLAEPP